MARYEGRHRTSGRRAARPATNKRAQVAAATLVGAATVASVGTLPTMTAASAAPASDGVAPARTTDQAASRSSSRLAATNSTTQADGTIVQTGTAGTQVTVQAPAQNAVQPAAPTTAKAVFKVVAKPGEGIRAEEGAFLIYPVNGDITSAFGMRFHPILHYLRPHEGADLHADCGVSVVAAREGVVKHAGPSGGFGLQVLIDHGNGVTTSYNHMQKITVRVGQKVKAGDYMGEVGNTGLSTNCHMHFEMRINNVPVDPAIYFKQNLKGFTPARVPVGA